jgi:hypothetical protein
MDCDGNACVPCGLHEPRRNAYFDGKLLLARDFEDEQVYHMAKRQLLNATLHGTGTICGLKVVEHPSDGCRAEFAVLEAGVALDCCGQEIIVPTKVPIPIAQLLDEDPDLVAALDGTRHLFISLTRCDRAGELAPVILGGCEGAAEGGKPGRILESYDFHLLAADPEEFAPVDHHHKPRLDWRQTLTFSQATPVAVAIDNDARYAYVSVVPENAEESEGATSRVLVYEQRNHDIVTALDGPAGPIDLAVSPVGDQVFLSFASGDGRGIAVYRKSAIRSDADPVATITREEPVRLVVSPRTGALFALGLDTGTITAWSQEAIATWLGEANPDPAGPAAPAETTLDGWDLRTPEETRGAVFTISPDGLRLLVLDGKGAAAVRMVEVALLFGGEPAELAPGGNPVLPTPSGEQPVAGNWSLDSRYVFLLFAAGTGEAPRTILRRYERIEATGALAQRGQGVAVPLAHALDLAVAPGERWAYALVGALDNERIEAKIVVLDMNLAQAGLPTDAPAEQLDAAEEPLPGEGLSQRLTLNGRQLYVALADESAEAQPDRGLVAVIEPDEADCGARFRDAVNGCATCVDSSHHVVLAHLPNYVAADRPRIRDKDPREGEVAIDNFTYRPLIPSSQNLRAVIQCILDEGVAEGPPGPRGDPGEQGDPGATGPRGPGIEQIAVNTLPANQPAIATLSPIAEDPEADLLLTLGIPRGANGTNGAPGPRGPGIQQVAVNTLPAGSSATAVLTPIAGDAEADLLLTLGIPRGADGSTPEPDLGHVLALSWRHNQPMSSSEFAELMEKVGIAIGFDRPVRADTLLHSKFGMDFSLVFELLTRLNDNDNCLCPVRLPVELLSDFTVEDELIVDAVPADGEEFVRGIRIAPTSDLFIMDVARVLLRCDFVLDEKDQAIDGNFLGGALPSGDGVAGGLFESWFWMLREDR